LKDTFVSGLSVLVGQAVHLQWSRFLQLCTRFSLQPHALVGVSRFPNLFSKVPSSSLLQFVFKNSFSIFCKPYYSNW